MVPVPYAAYISPCDTWISARLYYGLYMRDPQRGYGCQQGLYTYVGDARLKTHYPHGQMHVVALLPSPRLPTLGTYSTSRTPHFRIGSAVQRLVLLFRVRSEALGQSNDEHPIRLGSLVGYLSARATIAENASWPLQKTFPLLSPYALVL